MAEFTGENMRGSRFEGVDLTGSRLRNIDLTGVTIRGAMLVDLDLSGEVENLRINGVDVGPLIEAELNRRHPGRTKLQPTDADGFREAWAVIEASWPPTVDRARRLSPELLHARVDDEWSFIETLRHLVFATDAWVNRAVLGDPSPYDALDLPHTEMEPDPIVPNDPDARPTLDEVLALRAERMASVREVMAGLTDDALAGMTAPVPPPGYPVSRSYPVRRCLLAVVHEEWEHRLFAERDLAVLESR